MKTIDQIYSAVLHGEIDKVVSLVEETIKNKIKAQDVINKGFNKALKEVGNKFEKEEYFLPDMLIAAMTVKKGMETLAPELKGIEIRKLGTVVIGTVEGDVHDVGKDIVIMMMESAGFKVYDLGIDVCTEKFIKAINNYKPDILGMSALLNNTMQNMVKVIKKVEDSNLRDKIKIIVGGSPLNQEFADSIGADGYASDASKAVNKIIELLKI